MPFKYHQQGGAEVPESPNISGSSGIEKERRSVAVSASVVALGTLSSRILGLVRDVLLVSLFPRLVTDAWYVAFRIPNMFRRLLGEGSLAVSFIPVFIDTLKGQSPEEKSSAYKLACSVFTLLAIAVGLFSIMGTLFIEDVIAVLVSGPSYMAVEGKYELTVKMAKIMFAFIFLMSLYAYFMAILNSLKKFAIPALAPCFLNVAIIVAALLPEDFSSFRGQWLAWGVMIGGLLQVLVVVPSLVAIGFLPKPTFKLKSAKVNQVFKAFIPSMIGMGILQLTGFVNIQFASRLPQGSHSWIYLGDRILELPLSLFAVSLGTALLPTLSQFWSQGKKQEMAETVTHYMRLNYFIALPAAVGMWFLARPIVEVIFMHGQFDGTDAEQTASVVQVYAFALLAASGTRVLAQGFYATKNTWLPAVVSIVALSFHLVVAPHLMARYQVSGLVASTVMSAWINLILLMVFFNNIIGQVQLAKLLMALTKFTLAAAVMALVSQLYYVLFPLFGTGAWARSFALGLTIPLCVLVYFLVASRLKISEYHETVKTFGAKLRR